MGLSDKNEIIYTNGEIDHCVFQSVTSTNSYTPPHKLGHGTVNKNTHSTTATTIDKLYENKIIKNLSLIHLDVEGFELPVLLGAKNTILAQTPIILWENHLDVINSIKKKKEVEEIINYLKNLNYITYMLNEISGGNPNCRNFISMTEEQNKLFLSKYNILLLNNKILKT